MNYFSLLQTQGEFCIVLLMTQTILNSLSDLLLFQWQFYRLVPVLFNEAILYQPFFLISLILTPEELLKTPYLIFYTYFRSKYVWSKQAYFTEPMIVLVLSFCQGDCSFIKASKQETFELQRPFFKFTHGQQVILIGKIGQILVNKFLFYVSYLSNIFTPNQQLIHRYLSIFIHYQVTGVRNILSMKKFKLALLQTKCVTNKQANIKYISQALETAAKNGADISVLGQICNSPYNKDYMIKFAQDFKNSETLKAIQAECKKGKMYAIGSIPRVAGGKYFNTAFVINKQGELQTQMDKIHLFDIDIPGKITYKQSETFESGKQICVFDTQYCRFGLGICYDLRFAELGLIMRQKGARVLIYPGSFNQTTGPLHWQLLLRGRALDTQCFTIGVSAAQAKQSPELYQAWGHSTVVDPFGKVLVGLDENPNIQYCQIDPMYTEQVRTQIPIGKQKRNDLYKLEAL